MKVSIVFAFIAGGFLLSACASSDTSEVRTAAPALSNEVVTVVDGSEELICRRESQIGSVIPKRVCLTEEQWAELEREAQDGTAEIQRGSLRSCAAGAGCTGS